MNYKNLFWQFAFWRTRPAPTVDVWQKAELLERIGGDQDIVKHLKSLFDSTTPERMMALQKAFEAQDWDAMEKVSHELKGVAQNLVMPQLLRALVAFRKAVENRVAQRELREKMAAVAEAFERARREKI